MRWLCLITFLGCGVASRWRKLSSKWLNKKFVQFSSPASSRWRTVRSVQFGTRRFSDSVQFVQFSSVQSVQFTSCFGPGLDLFFVHLLKFWTEDILNFARIRAKQQTALAEYSRLVVLFLVLGQYLTQLWQVTGQIFGNSMIFFNFTSPYQQNYLS